jgi:hypothetical protein
VIDQVEPGVGQAHQLEAQEAGDLERPPRFGEPGQRRRLAARRGGSEVLEPGQRQLGQHQASGSELVEASHLGDLILEIAGTLARRARPQPFEHRHPARLVACGQAIEPVLAYARLDRGGDRLEDPGLLVPTGGDCQPPEAPLVRQNIAMIDQPGAGAPDEFVDVEDGHRLAPEIGDQPALGVRAEPAQPEHRRGHGLMLEQRPPAAVEGADRGDPRRRAIEPTAEMREHGLRHDLDRVQRPARHLQEADVQGHGHPVQRGAPRPHAGQLGAGETEELLDLDRRQGLGEPVPAQIPMLEAPHRIPPQGRYLRSRQHARKSILPCNINDLVKQRAPICMPLQRLSLPSLFARSLR